MQLRCKRRYRAYGHDYTAGQVFDVHDAIGAWLLRDSPGSFEAVEQTQKRTLKRPPRDKQIREATQK